MFRRKRPASPGKLSVNVSLQQRWWQTALLAAALATGLYVYLAPNGPKLGKHALTLFVALYLIVWFCNPASFFRRMSWVALSLVGGVVFIYFLHNKGYFGPEASTTFVISNAAWLAAVFSGAAVLFVVMEYLQHRSPPDADAVGDEIPKRESVSLGFRRRRDDELPPFPPPAPFKRNKRVPDQDTLTKILERYAAMPAPSGAPKVVVRMLRSERDRLMDRLDAALARADSLAQAGGAEAKAAAAAARDQLAIEPLQEFLSAEADRRGCKTREDATAYVAICREITGIAEIRGDWAAARRGLDEVIRLVPEDVDAFCRLGRACLLLNKLPDAEEAYQRVLVLSSEDEWRAMAFTNMGTVQLLSGSLEEAERVFDRAVEIDERIGDVQGMAANYANLGNVCRQRGKLGKAEKMFNAALEIIESQELSLSACC